MTKPGHLKLLHISDLHFSSGTHKSDSHQHDIRLLQGIEAVARDHTPTHLVVTGDITDRGDRASLLTAAEWLFHEVPIGNGQRIGLRFNKQKAIVVPGNHDAYDASRLKALKVWQTALGNYRSEFAQHYDAFMEENHGCSYNWLEDGDLAIYLVKVDSSYKGSDMREIGGFPTDLAGRGKISREQSRVILHWHGAAIKGLLPVTPDVSDGQTIDPHRFEGAIKILVTHHYLAEPTGHHTNITLNMKDREAVVRNTMMADFDVILCGHRHVLDDRELRWEKQFDPRSKNRYLLNCFKRIIGLAQTPLDHRSPAGKFNPRQLMWGLRALVRSSRLENLTIEEVIEKHAASPEAFEKALREAFSGDRLVGSADLTQGEMDQIVARLHEFSKSERQTLAAIASEELRQLRKILAQRGLLQVMSGSSAKSFRPGKDRALSLYEIKGDRLSAEFIFHRFQWDDGNSRFERQRRISYDLLHHRRGRRQLI